VAILSNRLRALVALRMPVPSPAISHSSVPPMTTERVAGSACLMIVVTGC
jgi:hypothetical protein